MRRTRDPAKDRDRKDSTPRPATKIRDTKRFDKGHGKRGGRGGSAGGRTGR